MPNIINEAHSIQDIVNAINDIHAIDPHLNDSRDGDEIAAEYAVECVLNADEICDLSTDLECHLEFLRDAGAEFNFLEARSKAIIQLKTIYPFC